MLRALQGALHGKLRDARPSLFEAAETQIQQEINRGDAPKDSLVSYYARSRDNPESPANSRISIARMVVAR